MLQCRLPKKGHEVPQQRFGDSGRGSRSVWRGCPFLFGASFKKKMKEHLESLKCLWQSIAPNGGYRGDLLFWGGCPQYPPWGGSSSYRGRDGQGSFRMPTKEIEGRYRDNLSRRKDSYHNCRSSLNMNRDFVWKNLTVARIKNFSSFHYGQSVDWTGDITASYRISKL